MVIAKPATAQIRRAVIHKQQTLDAVSPFFIIMTNPMHFIVQKGWYYTTSNRSQQVYKRLRFKSQKPLLSKQKFCWADICNVQ